MDFFSFWTPSQNIFKLSFWGVNWDEKHAGTEGFVLFGIKIELRAFFSQILTVQNTKVRTWNFFHFGLHHKINSTLVFGV